FKEHALFRFKENEEKIETSYSKWEIFSNNQFEKIKENEEKLNEIFIEIYGLQNEMTPDLIDKDITIKKANVERDIKSFISYAIGCALGRYSLDEKGLVFGGGNFDFNNYKTFSIDKDNII